MTLFGFRYELLIVRTNWSMSLSCGFLDVSSRIFHDKKSYFFIELIIQLF